jgi:hypothetical protein
MKTATTTSINTDGVWRDTTCRRRAYWDGLGQLARFLYLVLNRIRTIGREPLVSTKSKNSIWAAVRVTEDA